MRPFCCVLLAHIIQIARQIVNHLLSQSCWVLLPCQELHPGVSLNLTLTIPLRLTLTVSDSLYALPGNFTLTLTIHFGRDVILGRGAKLGITLAGEASDIIAYVINTSLDTLLAKYFLDYSTYALKLQHSKSHLHSPETSKLRPAKKPDSLASEGAWAQLHLAVGHRKNWDDAGRVAQMTAVTAETTTEDNTDTMRRVTGSPERDAGGGCNKPSWNPSEQSGNSGERKYCAPLQKSGHLLEEMELSIRLDTWTGWGEHQEDSYRPFQPLLSPLW